ncbi:hypothetical protein BDV96DRAFT_337334 [Lophiotrema nucula]|uniref:Zn(2)-C6 fungal-type domain-containing protein n=1 Tax=Lophiotrema nucula TaxID=690887 RepID=A0A6A5YGX7_9PLEO|nr:hypothetical protein BDV96DRAFT_337334 [Lophiotrema nucula]
MPRLGHKKSRNGCRQCKSRHVKCDENKPCSNCAKHGVQCSLVTWDGQSTTNPPPARVNKKPLDKPRKASNQATTTAAALPIEYVLNPSPAGATATPEGVSPNSNDDPFPYLTKFVNKNDTIQPNYWVRDLELMHHWTTEAYFTISVRDDIRDMWRLVAPKQAIVHHFLMHELLAFSALHLAYSQQEQRKAFYALGIHHQDLAIRAMRRMLPNMTAENAGALFGTAALVTLSVFGSTSLDAQSEGADDSKAIEDLLDIFALQQGIDCILSSAYPIVGQGPFAPALRISPMEVPPQPVLSEISDHLPTFKKMLNSKTMEEEDRKEIANALAAFKGVLDFAMTPYSDNRELRVIFLWPIKLSSRFFDLLRQRHPAALASVTIYAVILQTAEPIYWFMDGWSQRVIKAVLEGLDPSWQDAIEWPLQHIKAQQREQAQPPQQMDVQLR